MENKMGKAERQAIHATGAALAVPPQVGRAALQVCEEVVAHFSHANGCGPSFYQAAVEVLGMVKVAA
jgi:hypothetical protein